jgi:CxxC motif-containing protein (DUF1111 family)
MMFTKQRFTLFFLLSLCLVTSNRMMAAEFSDRSPDKSMDFAAGRSLFKKLWIAAPTATTSSDGLGPLYNARSCFQCHLNAGRGQVPRPQQRAVSLFMRLSIPAQNARDRQALKTHQQSVIPEPHYGTQFQTFAVTGLPAEGELQIRYTEVDIQLAGGETVRLQQPEYQLKNLHFGPLHPQTQMSPRLAPSLFGTGQLAKISEQAILQYSDPNDQDKNGISGKPNRVWSRTFKQVMLGRFGYKAGVARLDEQNQRAFVGDLGISTPLFPQAWGDCTPHQAICRNAPHGYDAQQALEAPKKVTDAVLYYVSHLTLPKQPSTPSTDVIAGQQHFIQAGCVACHRPSFQLDDAASNQKTIAPYSDLLLHDMGEGLADHRPEGDANGQEWRTTPLWGIGLTERINGHHYYLHDGRATTLQQAILWHGGEAKKAHNYYVKLAKKERQQLLQFLGTL